MTSTKSNPLKASPTAWLINLLTANNLKAAFSPSEPQINNQKISISFSTSILQIK